MWKTSVQDIVGDILCVSQFTLVANTTKNKPDFHRAMARSCRFVCVEFCYLWLSLLLQPSEASRALYADFLSNLRKNYSPDKIHGSSAILFK
jgi:D-tyrosyl-tRNA(Tyr) deacylase